NAVAPFEVVAWDARPRGAAIRRAPCRRFEAAGVKHGRMPRVDGHVIDMLVGIMDLLPGGAAIGRQEDSAVARALPGPRGEIQTPRIFGIDGKTVRSVDAFGQGDLFPRFGAIGRAIK